MARRSKSATLEPPASSEGSDSLCSGFEHHLKYGLATDRKSASPHQIYTAVALAVRDRLIDRWSKTRAARINSKAKRIYYLSLEFLIGRSLGNNIINLGLDDVVRETCRELGIDWDHLSEEEPEPGLGNGGLGRLAACFLDSLATLQYPAIGYGLRYDYGIFRQRIEHGRQQELPDDWLAGGNPWEMVRPNYRVPVRFGGHVEHVEENGKQSYQWVGGFEVVGLPYDMPVVGYGGTCVNILRLWSARASQGFSFDEFNKGDYQAAVERQTSAETLTKVLYPSDHVYAGQELRLKQQYFFVACSLHDILRRFKSDHSAPWDQLPDKVAIQLNDTHPSLSVAELMRLLVDRERLDWDKAWDITVRCLGYTNHTLLPEALEKWPVAMFEKLLPRHLQIIYEINRRFLGAVAEKFPGDTERLRRMSIIEETPKRQVRMAHLSVVGSHSTNGVAALHTELLRESLLRDFNEMYPDRFNNKTNGVTPRRWLLKANPPLAELITETIGSGWITDLAELRKLEKPSGDAAFRSSFRKTKHQAKLALCRHARREWGFEIDPASLFDAQVKRLHEYKRQLLNALHICMLYNRLRNDRKFDMVPRTFLFSAKAAPGYALAKVIIEFINALSSVIDRDPAARGKLSVFFLPNYNVGLAERIIPATDVSEQISLAGFEASGTGNMKFMMNGALTVGTLDGANVEMLEEAGKENIFIFGLTASEAEKLRPSYNPHRQYEKDAETREVIDLIRSGHFSPGDPGRFELIIQTLLDHGDHYMHLADLPDYARTHKKVDRLYRDQEEWSRKAILNVARSGKFSSDRTIRDYAREVWDIRPIPI